MDPTRIEYREVGIGTRIPIELPAAEWIQIGEWIRYADIPGQEGLGPVGLVNLLIEITQATITPASIKATESRREQQRTEHMEAHSPIGLLRTLGFPVPGGVGIPSPEDFNRLAVCPNCQKESTLDEWTPDGDSVMRCPRCQYPVDTQ